MIIEAMKQALEALENPWGAGPEGVANAITALRTAIAEAEKQEPVLKPCWYESKEKTMCRKCGQVHAEAILPNQEKQEPYGWVSQHTTKGLYEWQFNKEVSGVYKDTAISILPVYTRQQPKREPLTDEEIEAKFKKCGGSWNGDLWEIEDADLHPFVRSIESPDLKTLQAVSDEYNAWIKHTEAEKQEAVAIGEEWKPCVKLPIVVHVREQRKGETHVSTREGITPVKEDDLIMRGVAGEEYPIGRELFNRTYTFDIAPPKREPLTDEVCVPLRILEAVEASLGAFCSDHGWSDVDMQNMDNLSAHIIRHKAAHGIKGEA